jgi:hypothetical protein
MKAATTSSEVTRRELTFADLMAELRRYNTEMKRWEKRRQADWEAINRSRARTAELWAEIRRM